MEQKTAKIQAHNLRRLWHWVQNSTPNQYSYQGLRAASRELGKILCATTDDDGLPALPRELPVDGEVVCTFSEMALSGFRQAIQQAISGQNHPQHTPAPFGSIEHLILPLAEVLGIAEMLRNECPILSGTEFL